MSVLGALLCILSATLVHWSKRGIEDGDRLRRTWAPWASIPIAAVGVAAIVVDIATR